LKDLASYAIARNAGRVAEVVEISEGGVVSEGLG
jgi:hypothetical protein